MNKITVVIISLFIVLLLSVIFAYSFEKTLTANVISRLRERARTYAKTSQATTSERSASAASSAWEGSGSSGAVDSGPAGYGYQPNGTSAPMPTQSR